MRRLSEDKKQLQYEFIDRKTARENIRVMQEVCTIKGEGKVQIIAKGIREKFRRYYGRWSEGMKQARYQVSGYTLLIIA